MSEATTLHQGLLLLHYSLHHTQVASPSPSSLTFGLCIGWQQVVSQLTAAAQDIVVARPIPALARHINGAEAHALVKIGFALPRSIAHVLTQNHFWCICRAEVLAIADASQLRQALLPARPRLRAIFEVERLE